MANKIPVITIDTGVPVPELVVYPFEQLKVGESFLVPIKKRSSVAARASRLSASSDKEYVVRKVDANSVRVWRTK